LLRLLNDREGELTVISTEAGKEVHVWHSGRQRLPLDSGGHCLILLLRDRRGRRAIRVIVCHCAKFRKAALHLSASLRDLCGEGEGAHLLERLTTSSWRVLRGEAEAQHRGIEDDRGRGGK